MRFPLISLSSLLLAFAVTSVPSQAQESTQQAGANYGKLPLSFETNQGQTNPSVDFLSHGRGYTLFLRPGEAVLALNPAKPAADSAYIRMDLIGANPKAPISREDPQTTRTNYFLGNDPRKWRTDVPNYGRVRYRAVYEGIDLVYYGNQRRLEHDFVIAPHADPAKIVFTIEGAGKLRIDPATGDLVLLSAAPDLRLLKPATYQESNGRRTEIPSTYKLLANNRITFALGSYNHSQPLIIDPVLVYSTYLGGSGSGSNGDQGNGIAVDSNGSAYIVGTTYSANFPVTPGAFQYQTNAPSGTSTVFVSKLNPAGTALIYSTYLGGSGGDEGYGIALDSNSNAYITGATHSTDFPITCGAFQTANPATGTNITVGFVTKLDSAGSALVYSTYLSGGDPGSVSQAIAVNAAGNAYVTGYTYSSDFPTTTGAFQTDFKGNASISNAFVTELNLAGTALVYSTYLGGSGEPGANGNPGFSPPEAPNGDYGNAIALDTSGDAFIAGSTGSSDFPVTASAFQTGLQGPSNAFVTELNPAGTQELYSTYLGGSGQINIPDVYSWPISGDSATAIAVDSSGFAYVAGNTTSSNFPVTAGVLEGADDFDGASGTGFVSKLSQNGSKLIYSTYLEGAETSISSLVIDRVGNAYIAGNVPTLSAGQGAGFELTPDALPTPASSANSAFVVKINPSATAMNYATLLGGSINDAANALALDAAGDVYLTGFAGSANFPVTPVAFQANLQGPRNAFVSKFALAGETGQTVYPSIPANVPSTVVDAGLDQLACTPGGATPGWALSVSVTLQGSPSGPPPTGIVSFFDNPGHYSEGPPGYIIPVIGTSWGGNISLFFGDNVDYGAQSEPFSIFWSAQYSGDAYYAPSTVSGAVYSPGCPIPPDVRTQSPRPLSLLPQISASSSSPSASNAPSTAVQTAGQPLVRGPKFIPAIAPEASRSSLTAKSQQTAACIATGPLLTVTLHSSSRLYGAANPTFTYTVSGLLNGDKVTVTPFTTATAQSPVGSYPISATVTGAAVANYELVLNNATLTVTKAPLYIQAGNVHLTYGQTPTLPLAYTLHGFVNGDTQATATTGAPALTTTATSSTPVGFYPIGVGIGTLSAPNYYFNTTYSGMGSVQIFKAQLYIQAKNVRVVQGHTPVLPLAYNLIGFVNGETQATATTGQPSLTTTVTASSPPGFYPIAVGVGTLSAPNYQIHTTYSGMGTVQVVAP